MMCMGPQATHLPEGDRLHLHHGPIDLIIGVSAERREDCFARAIKRFQTILTGLVGGLEALRRPLRPDTAFSDPVAHRMAVAVGRHAGVFVTPMAAVAGAVADEVLAAMLDGQAPRKAYVNNGGDIAFHLNTGERFDVLSPAGKMTVAANEAPRGVATSGWRGRSHSFGIAEAVTVLADTSAAADVAATLIANAVDLPGHPAIHRQRADDLSPDSDLGNRMVTTDVGRLDPLDVLTALNAGAGVAEDMRWRGLIHAAAICLQGQSLVLETIPLPDPLGACAHA